MFDWLLAFQKAKAVSVGEPNTPLMITLKANVDQSTPHLSSGLYCCNDMIHLVLVLCLAAENQVPQTDTDFQPSQNNVVLIFAQTLAHCLDQHNIEIRCPFQKRSLA